MKLKALMEAAGRKLAAPKRKLLNRLLEAGMMDGDMDMPAEVEAPAEDAPAADHTQALMDGFQGAIMSIVQSCLSGEMDCKEASKKIAEMLKTHGKLSDSDSPAEPVEEEEDEDLEECEDDDKAMKESKRLRRRLRAHELLEEARVPADKLLIESLVALGSVPKMQAFIEREKGRQAPAAGHRPQVRSGAGGGGSGKSHKQLTEQQQVEELSDFVSELRG